MTEAPSSQPPYSSVTSSSVFHRRRPLFWLALALCGGIALDAAMAFSYGVVLLAALSMLAIGLLILVLMRPRAVFAVGLFFALTLGAVLHAERFRIPAQNDICNLTPARPCFVWIRGVIVEAEWRAPSAARDASGFSRINWTVAVKALGREESALAPASGKMRLAVRLKAASGDDENSNRSSRAETTLAEGDEIECRALVEPLPEATLPDGFDYGGYLLSQGVRRMGSTQLSAVRQVCALQWWRVHLLLRRWSGMLAARTEELLGGEAEQAGLLNAMVFGRREALSVSDREAFGISGTAHLLAISGLHVQLICLAIYRLLGYFGLPRRRAAWSVLAVALVYCLLTGASPPAIRATTMLACYLAATIFWRDADPLNTLAAAALLVLALSPQELFSVGFQLSFLAVLSLVTVLPAFNDAWEKWDARRRIQSLRPAGKPGWRDWIFEKARQAFFVTLAATLATAPSVAWHMGRFSTLSLVVNLLAVPFLSVCMFFGIVTVGLGAIVPALGKIVGYCAWVSLFALEKVTSFFAGLPGSSLDMPRPPIAVLIAYCGILIWIWISRKEEGSEKRLYWLVPVAVLLLLSSLIFRNRPSTPELTILDLPRGRSALLETPAGNVLIDAGGKGQGLRIAEMLRRKGSRSCELLVLTADDPGAIGGALEFVRRVPPARVIFPRAKFPSEARRELEVYLWERKIPYASANEPLQMPQGVALNFFDDGPSASQPASNNAALCVRVDCGTFKMVFAETGSSASLGRLLPKMKMDAADVLRIVPGAQNRWPKETLELIKLTAPKLIVAGTTHEADELPGVDFDALNIQTLSPRHEGSIRVRVENGKMKMDSYRGRWREVVNWSGAGE